MVIHMKSQLPPSLTILSLKEFIENYSEQLEDYYDEDFGKDMINEIGEGDTQINCLVDTGCNRYTSPKNKKNIRKAGKKRRKKIKHKYSYENPFNRVHGYLISDEIRNSLIPCDSHVSSLNLICSSSFTDYRGIGDRLMKNYIDKSKQDGFTDLILEVSNEWAGIDQEDSDSSDEDSDSSDDEESDDIWIPSDDVVEILSHEFWRKTMRLVNNIPYYNVSKEYVMDNISNYLYSSVGEMMEKSPKYLSEDPGEYEYGGYWYQKGKNTQQKLMKFYENYGFMEEPDIHLSWHCYGDSPFPTMVKVL